MSNPFGPQPGNPYPPDWERNADVRVFRANAEEWDKLTAWSADMRKRGWRLLKVTTEGSQLVAVFGKTREQSLRLPR